MPQQRILKGVHCPCGGNIGYDQDSDSFKCLDCGAPYTPEEEGLSKAVLAQRKYRDSEKGETKEEEYHQSGQYRKIQSDYGKSVKGKLSRRKYYYGDKGQAAHARRQKKIKLFKKIQKYLEENPGKTIQDFYKENPDAAKV